MQGISGRSHGELLRALNNVADGSLRLALLNPLEGPQSGIQRGEPAG
jgi:hypothetical protein